MSSLTQTLYISATKCYALQFLLLLANCIQPSYHLYVKNIETLEYLIADDHKRASKYLYSKISILANLYEKDTSTEQ